MLSATPAWVLSDQMMTAYDHMQLLPHRVIGTWLCAQRSSGKLIWSFDAMRPNQICGIVDSVMIATENYPVGMMGTGNFHRYGISLESGQLLWTSHPSGTCGEASPFSTWDLEDFDVDGDATAPRLVEDGKCLCKDGSIIDPLSGHQIGQMAPRDVELRASRMMNQRSSERSRAFYRSISQERCRGIQLSRGKWLSGERFRSLQFALCNVQGACEWSFDLRQIGYEQKHPSYYQFRLVDQYIYIVAYEPFKEEPPVPGEWKPPEPRRFHLLTVDLTNGKVAQDIPIGNRRLCTCQLEDADQGGILIRASKEPQTGVPWKCSISYFERQ